MFYHKDNLDKNRVVLGKVSELHPFIPPIEPLQNFTHSTDSFYCGILKYPLCG